MYANTAFLLEGKYVIIILLKRFCIFDQTMTKCFEINMSITQKQYSFVTLFLINLKVSVISRIVISYDAWRKHTIIKIWEKLYCLWDLQLK